MEKGTIVVMLMYMASVNLATTGFGFPLHTQKFITVHVRTQACPAKTLEMAGIQVGVKRYI